MKRKPKPPKKPRKKFGIARVHRTPGGWQTILGSTIPLYLREMETNTLRNRILLAMMESKGRIKIEHKAGTMDWHVKFGVPEEILDLPGYKDWASAIHEKPEIAPIMADWLEEQAFPEEAQRLRDGTSVILRQVRGQSITAKWMDEVGFSHINDPIEPLIDQLGWATRISNPISSNPPFFYRKTS